MQQAPTTTNVSLHVPLIVSHCSVNVARRLFVQEILQMVKNTPLMKHRIPCSKIFMKRFFNGYALFKHMFLVTGSRKYSLNFPLQTGVQNHK